jgi:T5orf172 domain
MVTLGKEEINAFIEGQSGIKHSQLMLLKEYPARSGWKNRLLGTKITNREYDLLVRSKGIYLDNGQLKVLQDDRQLFLDMYEYLLDKNLSPMRKFNANPLDAKRHVYVLVLKDRSKFKIGQSLNPLKRISFLENTWGPADYDNSYIVRGLFSGKELEASLHFLLKKWNVAFEDGEQTGDGYTEWFKPEAYKLAFKEIKRISDLQKIEREIIPLKKLRR